MNSKLLAVLLFPLPEVWEPQIKSIKMLTGEK